MKDNYYVNNKELYAILVEYKNAVKKAKKNDQIPPRIPEEVGLAIKLIAEKLNSAGNFGGYSYRDEMVADGIEHCIKYLYNFNPDKYDNPFAYFTQICYRASQMRIKKEKRQANIKTELIRNSSILDNLDVEDFEGENTYIKFLLDSIDQKDKDNASDEIKVKKRPGRKTKKELELDRKIKEAARDDMSVNSTEDKEDSNNLQEFFSTDE